MGDSPRPGEDAHVAIAVVFVGFVITTGNPRQLCAEESIPERLRVGVRHDDLAVLNGHGVTTASPQSYDDQFSDETWESEEEVVPMYSLASAFRRPRRRLRGREDFRDRVV